VNTHESPGRAGPEHTGYVTARCSLRNGTALLLTGSVLIAGGTATLLWPERRVAAEVGSVLAAPAHPTPISDAEERNPPTVPPSASAPAPAGFVPQRLVVASLEIDAPLIATLVDADGALVPPEDPAQLAWWGGVRPGTEAGSVLVAGHLDMHGYGQGPLARIAGFEAGDRAVLTGADGARAVYVLRGVTTIAKESLPTADLFGAGGRERLVLVTCGGAYDRDRRSWDSNVIAVLDPVPTG
jgi:Sortase domain